MRTVTVLLLMLLAAAPCRRDRAVAGRSRRPVARRLRHRAAARSSRSTASGRPPTTDPSRPSSRCDADAWLKGDLGATVRFRVPGGRLGRYRSLVVGAPKFEAGQQVVVFLGATPPSLPYVLGLSQGVFRVAQGAAGAVVTPPAVMPVSDGTRRVTRGDLSRRPLAARRVRAAGTRARAGAEVKRVALARRSSCR